VRSIEVSRDKLTRLIVEDQRTKLELQMELAPVDVSRSSNSALPAPQVKPSRE
jgi:hypothetical protein